MLSLKYIWHPGETEKIRKQLILQIANVAYIAEVVLWKHLVDN